MSTPTNATFLGGDLATGSRFLFEVDGVEIGIFGSVSGLQVSVATEEITEGGQNGFVHRVPGRFSWPNIVLKRGLTQADALFDWMQKVSGDGFAANNNAVTRMTGAITAIGDDGTRIRSWNLDAVLPVRWKGPDFDVANSAPLSEELEICHHGFRSATPT
jgi:phage tail-like protein